MDNLELWYAQNSHWATVVILTSHTLTCCKNYCLDWNHPWPWGEVLPICCKLLSNQTHGISMNPSQLSTPFVPLVGICTVGLHSLVDYLTVWWIPCEPSWEYDHLLHTLYLPIVFSTRRGVHQLWLNIWRFWKPTATCTSRRPPPSLYCTSHTAHCQGVTADW